MKSKSGIQKTFEGIGMSILLAVFLFACAASPGGSQVSVPVVKPTKTKTPSAPTTKSPKNNEPPSKNFSLQNANKRAPDDILKEVAYGGRGGGGYCGRADTNYPAVDEDNSSQDIEWLEPMSVFVCGWPLDEEVSLTINRPNGSRYTETLKVEEVQIFRDGETLVMPYVYYYYYPDASSTTGRYNLTFSGKSGDVDYSVNVSMPSTPRMYYIESIQAYYLYNFFPNEEIRLFLYEQSGVRADFVAWERYVVDNNGRLIIKANRGDGLYFVIGERSGPLDEAYIIEGQSSAVADATGKKTCPGLPSRLTVGKYAYVATDPPLDNRVRDGAGTNYSIIGYITTGHAMKILDGPKCANGMTWWKVQSIKNSSVVGWTAEGDDTYWLIPCASLSSCP